MSKGVVVRWLRPRKPSLDYAEHFPTYEAEMQLLVEQKERELQKTIARLRAPLLGRRRELKKSERAPVQKRIRVRGGFVDRLRMRAYGGRGGDGVVAFARAPHVRVAPPSGGDAGKGGSVWVVADSEVRSLRGIPRQVRAGNGGNGATNNKHGADGKDAVVRVPVGTVVNVATAGQSSELQLRTRFLTDVLAELNEEGQRVCLARGGAGGKGNAAFVSSTNRSPREATAGLESAPVTALLELKMLAHVGLVGMPNAGKSSLLYTISSSSPRIASYPFTTLQPTVGNVLFDDGTHVSVCDIPGIIAGAHQNVGLGLEFLRHIERTALLCYVLDGSPENEMEPVKALEMLRAEVAAYDEKQRLHERESVIVCNKMDVAGAHTALERLIAVSKGVPVFGISCRNRDGIEPLMLHLRSRIHLSKT